jgi:hypothetical protein
MRVESSCGSSFETPADGGLLRMRSACVVEALPLMVRRRDRAVSNHEARILRDVAKARLPGVR